MSRIQNCRLRKRQHRWTLDGRPGVVLLDHETPAPGAFCSICGAKVAPKDTFAKLAYVADWKRDMARLWKSIAVEMVRPQARALLKRGMEMEAGGELPPWSIFDVTDSDRELASLLDIALVDYKLQHSKARGNRLWIFTAPDGKGRASVACRFCGRILVPSARLGGYYSSETYDHVAWCALSALATAGSAKPVTRKRPNTEGAL